MATKKVHLEAILAMRLDWTDTDRLTAERLAELRAQLDRATTAAGRAPATTTTAAGGVKPHPAHVRLNDLAAQEAQLTRRLRLNPQRTASGQYEATDSPVAARQRLWDEVGELYADSLLFGAWLGAVDDAKCAIPEDAYGWPNSPKTLPMAGQQHEVGDVFAFQDASMRPRVR